MKDNSETDNILRENRKEFPFLTNVESTDIVEHIKLFKAQLYDAEKWAENLRKFINAYETELLCRPVDKRIHYFGDNDRYRIDEENKK